MKKLFPLLMPCVILFSISNKSVAQVNPCGLLRLYINPNLIKAPYTIAQWKSDNPEMYICHESANEIIVDLVEMDAALVPAWRKKNSKYINFESSGDFIRKAHWMDPYEQYKTEIDLTEERIIDEDFEGYTFKELMDKFDLDYEHPSYENYLRVKRNLLGAVRVSSEDKFDEDYFLFSSPLLYSILKEAGITKDNPAEYQKCFFAFTIITMPTAASKTHQEDLVNDKYKAMMKFTYKGKIYYYDFSDDPIRSLLKK